MSYSVVLEGTVLPGFDPAATRAQLAKLTGQNEATAARLLAGTPRKVKSNIDEATATRYADALRRIGVASRVEGTELEFDLDGQSPAPETRKVAGSNQKHCPGCGEVLHRDALSCTSCGAAQPGTKQVEPPPTPKAALPANPAAAPQVQYVRTAKSRGLTAVLAIFLGTFGIHKFYLGKASGLWYLLFCWTFIPTIIGVIEGIRYLFMSDESFAVMAGEAPKGVSPPRGRRLGVLVAILLVLMWFVTNSVNRGTSTSPTPSSKASTTATDATRAKAAAVPEVREYGVVATSRGKVEISGTTAPDGGYALVFTPAVPIEGDTPRFIREVVERLYGVRVDLAFREHAPGLRLTARGGDYLFVPMKEQSDLMAGALLKPL